MARSRSSPTKTPADFDVSQVDLDLLFVRFHSSADRELERQRLRMLTIATAGSGPLSGGWYWLPAPIRERGVNWRVQAFYDCWRTPSDHIHVWRQVLDSLRSHWRRSLKNIDYCSLPRGRVAQPLQCTLAKTGKPQFAIYHGDDSPIGRRGLQLVRRAFNLPRTTRAYFDEHEQCIAGQPESLSRALGYDLGLTGIETTDLDWND